MKKLSLLIALACATLHAQEWKGTTPPTVNDRDIDSLKKINRIAEDSKTNTHALNMIVLLSPIIQATSSGEWNGTTFPSVNDTVATASLKKINKILNDARTGTHPLYVNGVGGGSGVGTVTNVSGTTGQITVTNPTTTPVLSIPNAMVFTGAATLKAQSWKLIGQTNYSTLITALDTTGYVALGDVDTAHNGTNIEISDQFSSINIKAGTSILLNGPVTANSITVSGASALAAVSASGAVTGAGFTARFATPGPIGSTSASTGAFTTLSASSTVSGQGFIDRLATPGPIGNTSASTVAATTLSASSTVSGQGFIDRLATPGPIGNTSASTIAATTLSASSTVSGTGFVNRFSTPGPIGDGTPSTGAFTTLSASSTVSGAGFDNIKAGAIGITIDGGGSAITTGTKGDIQVPFNCTITAVTMLADTSGSAVVDVWKDVFANYPPTVADSITASAKPTISAATNSTDSTLTGWGAGKTVTAGDTIRFNVDSASTITRLTIELKYTK